MSKSGCHQRKTIPIPGLRVFSTPQSNRHFLSVKSQQKSPNTQKYGKHRFQDGHQRENDFWQKVLDDCDGHVLGWAKILQNPSISHRF